MSATDWLMVAAMALAPPMVTELVRTRSAPDVGGLDDSAVRHESGRPTPERCVDDRDLRHAGAGRTAVARSVASRTVRVMISADAWSLLS